MSLEYIQIFLKVSNDKFQWLEHDHQAKMYKNTEMNFMLCNLDTGSIVVLQYSDHSDKSEYYHGEKLP